MDLYLGESDKKLIFHKANWIRYVIKITKTFSVKDIKSKKING